MADHAPRRWRALARVSLFFVACAAVLAATAPLAPRLPTLAPELVVGTVAGLGAFALTALFVRWEGLRLADVGAAPARRSALRLLAGLLFGSLLVALHSCILAVVGHVRWAPAPSASPAAATVALLGYLALACREELAFHGYPLRRLAPLLGVWGAQLVVALVFALEHVAGGSAWGQALAGPFVGSLLFGMAAIATRGLALPIGLHAAWNLGDWARGGKGASGLWTPIVEHGFDGRARGAGIVGYVAVTCSATVALWWWYRRRARAA